jgi:hypothetical protein
MEVAIDRLNDVCTELEEIYENWKEVSR